MKKRTKSARPTDDEVRARDAQIDAIVAGAAALKSAGAPTILDHFSIEQRAQIRRLSRAGDFEGTTEDEAIAETIAWLAEAALYVLGLDPIAYTALDRVAEAVYGESGFASDLFNANE